MRSLHFFAILSLFACDPAMGGEDTAAPDVEAVPVPEPAPEPKPLPKPDILAEMSKAKGAGDKVEAQEKAIKRHTDEVEDINAELADIIEKLRLAKGLPPKNPYKAPTDQHHIITTGPIFVVGPMEDPMRLGLVHPMRQMPVFDETPGLDSSCCDEVGPMEAAAPEDDDDE